jgi:hypothetical protein
MKVGQERFLTSNALAYSPRQLFIFEKVKEKNRKEATNNLVINELEFMEYPVHRTAIYYLSRVKNPDYVVIYTYGGTNPHIFHYNEQGEIAEECKLQFTWEWMDKWLSNNVAIAILDVPTYFRINSSLPSSYRNTPDRLRECLQAIDCVAARFPHAKIAWHGMSYGCIEASRISLLETKVEKVVLTSGPFHILEGWDEYHQGARLDKYDVSQAKVPVLIAHHKTEVFDKAKEEMAKTDSILVTNSSTSSDGHYFRRRQIRVVAAICDWIRGNDFPREIP